MSQGVGGLLILMLNLYTVAIIVYALMSWVSPSPYNPFVRFITNICEPTLSVIRNVLPRGLGVDISPIVAIAIIYLTKRVIVNLLM
jgi:YggT family protein